MPVPLLTPCARTVRIVSAIDSIGESVKKDGETKARKKIVGGKELKNWRSICVPNASIDS